jgi:DNA topoisomerase-1
MKLVIVESPGKTKKIASFLGEEYKVEASFGHIRDLDPKELSVDIENNFKPKYSVSSDKISVVKKLRSIAMDCDEVILASDQDREGEAIAESLKEELHLKFPKRIVFNEITKNAVLHAISNPTLINQPMVEAQQTRRILDRLVGYQISPLLWKFLPGTKSAGRVQSVLVRILVNQEDKINNASSDLRVKVSGDFGISKKIQKTVLMLDETNEIHYFDSLSQAEDLFKKLTKDDEFYLFKIEKTKNKRSPPPPFITSSLQQDASIKLRFPAKKTMMVAQKLYEAGYITYMRTDSTILSKEALKACGDYIKENFGEEYYKSRQFQSKSKNAQEAHEAVRPTKIQVSVLPDKYGTDEKRLYQLIWNRTMASQMADAQLEHQKIYIKTKNKSWKKYSFSTTLTKIIFDGFLKIYQDSNNDSETNPENDTFLKVKENDIVSLKELLATEDFKALPLRMNEPNLIKYLETKGIGRPSTYASLISKVLERGYVEIKDITGQKKKINQLYLDDKLTLTSKNKEILFGSEKKKLVPTELGIKSNEFLIKYFDKILEENFTAHLEDQLDEISNGKIKWLKVMQDFYQNLKPIIDNLTLKVSEIKNINVNDELLLVLKDKRQVYTGTSKYGKFIKVLEDNVWKFASIPKTQDPKKLSEKEILQLLEYPKTIGKKGNTLIQLCHGEYGFYLKMGKINHSVKEEDIKDLTVDKALELFEKPSNPNVLKTFTHKNKIIYLKTGQYGEYLQASYRNKNINTKAPKDISKLTGEEAWNLIVKKAEEPKDEKFNKFNKFKKGDSKKEDL